MKGKKIKPSIKFIATSVILAALLIYIAKVVFGFLRNQEYFKVKEIIVINSQVDFSYLKGRNIFDIDIKKLSLAIHKKYPENKLINVSRVMPNRLLIEFKRRQPIAILRLHKNFFIDYQGVLFEADEGMPEVNLTVIEGLKDKITNPHTGLRYNLRELESALNLIRIARYIGLLKKCPLRNIDASDHQYLLLTLFDNLKVRISDEDMPNKLRFLLTLISQANLDLTKVEYIDLRFKDPTIKFKNTDEK